MSISSSLVISLCHLVFSRRKFFAVFCKSCLEISERLVKAILAFDCLTSTDFVFFISAMTILFSVHQVTIKSE